MPPRSAQIERHTSETQITLALNLDEAGDPASTRIATGVGFFDHMLTHVARHGRVGLSVQATGDTHIDDHHTVEDVGIALGQALDQALADRKGIERFGQSSVPMDEALAHVALDLSGRGVLAFDVPFINPAGKIGTFDVQLVREFFEALTRNAKFACHIDVPRGTNDHHIAEAIFKAFGRALRDAVAITSDDIPSTKGVL